MVGFAHGSIHNRHQFDFVHALAQSVAGGAHRHGNVAAYPERQEVATAHAFYNASGLGLAGQDGAHLGAVEQDRVITHRGLHGKIHIQQQGDAE